VEAVPVFSSSGKGGWGWMEPIPKRTKSRVFLINLYFSIHQNLQMPVWGIVLVLHELPVLKVIKKTSIATQAAKKYLN
jgi:hypothetical protein